MRRRSMATLLVLTLASGLGISLAAGVANATTTGWPGAWHLASHHVAPINPRTGLPVGTLPTRRQLTRMARANASTATSSTLQQNSSSTYHLTYNGGPVVSNVEVQPVLWGSGTYIPEVAGSVTPNMHTFFQSITQTPYSGWLSEYNTTVAGGTGQRIGAGSVLPTIPITPTAPADGTTIDDQQIEQELFNQIVSGALPQPTLDAQQLENTTYVLQFPAGVNICQDSQLTQCSGYPPGNPAGSPVFCGYHSSFAVLNSSHQKVADVRYVVLPDSSTSLWQSGCSDPSSSNPAATGLEAVASHELAEVITDPEVGEASSLAAPLGWYDASTSGGSDPGEIADICDVAQPYTHTTGITGTDGQPYVLENLWSNRTGRCGIIAPPTSVTNVVARPRAGGTISVTWSAPSIGGGSPVHYDIYESPSGGTLTKVATTTATSWVSGPLSSGTSYVFMVEAANSAGSASGVESSWTTADSTAPAVKITSGPPTFSLTSTTKIAYAATDSDSSTGITYDVAYKSVGWNGSSWGALTSIAHGTTSTSASLSLRPGTEYCIVVRARDSAGNLSGWSGPRCTASPLDDTALSAKTTGWTRAKVSAAYHGTVTKTSKAGAKLAVTGAITNRLGLVVATCPTCGNVQIFLGSTLWKTISTKSSSWHYKHLLLPGTFSPQKTTVVIRVASGQAVIDGLGISRRAPSF